MAEVLSTISGMPAVSAILGDGGDVGDIAARVGDRFAENGARIAIDAAFDAPSRSSKSTNFADQPKRLIVWVNCVIVPP